jgi:hypothetical protein
VIVNNLTCKAILPRREDHHIHDQYWPIHLGEIPSRTFLIRPQLCRPQRSPGHPSAEVHLFFFPLGLSYTNRFPRHVHNAVNTRFHVKETFALWYGSPSPFFLHSCMEVDGKWLLSN